MLPFFNVGLEYSWCKGAAMGEKERRSARKGQLEIQSGTASVLPDRQIIRISVRNLVEFVMKGGDIDNRRTSRADLDAMQAGSRIHRKIQKRQGADYQAEVVMRHVVEEEKRAGPTG